MVLDKQIVILLMIIAVSCSEGMRLLEKAPSLDPGDPRPSKYLAIAHVKAHYQYDSALKKIGSITMLPKHGRSKKAIRCVSCG